MKKSLKLNYFYNMAYQLLAIIMPIITTPYVARVLGAKGVGVYSYTISIVTYFICFGSLGINLYGQREIAYVQSDKKKRSKVFYELFLFKVITMLISTTIFYIFFSRSGEYSLYYKILLLEMLANCFEISWFFQGLEEFKKITIRNFILRIINVICIFVFIKSSTDVWKYILIYCLGNLFGNLALFFDLRKYIIFTKEINIKKHIIPVLLLFIPQIATSIYIILDKIMLGAMLNNMTEVGYYEQAHKIIRILLTLITALGTTMLPRIANCFVSNDREKINNYMIKTFQCIFLLAFPMMFGIIAVSSNFVPLFLGNEYDKVKLILSVMSIIIIFVSLSSVTGTQYLLPTKKQKQYTISVFCGAVLNFILNFILIKKFQSLGATIATVFAELVVSMVQLYYVNKELKVKSILKKSYNYFVSALLMFFICIIIDKIISNNLIGMIMQVSLGAISYFTSLIFLLKDKFVLGFYSNIISKIKKVVKK